MRKPNTTNESKQLEAEYEAEAQAELVRAEEPGELHGVDGRRQEQVSDKDKSKPAPIPFDEQGLMKAIDSSDEMRVARWMHSTGVCPPTYKTPEQVAMGIQLLKSYGLNVMASIRQTAYINGSLCIWGDLPLALVRNSGKIEKIKEYWLVAGKDGEHVVQSVDNNNLHLDPDIAVCIIKRRDEEEEHAYWFGKTNAEKAGLLNNVGKQPWQKYTRRMLKLRARGEALKDRFPDVLNGVAIQEYDDLEGYEPISNVAPETKSLTGEINAMFEDGEAADAEGSTGI